MSPMVLGRVRMQTSFVVERATSGWSRSIRVNTLRTGRVGALGKNHQLGLRRCEINTCRYLLKELCLARSSPLFLPQGSQPRQQESLLGNPKQSWLGPFSIDVERVLFGSDFPYFDAEDSLDYLGGTGLSANELELIMGGNTERIFAL